VDCPARVNTLEACPYDLVTVAATAMQMQKQTHQATIDETKRATEYLANERTFLAWVRTSIAVISLGFVLARFSVWLRELSIQRQPDVRVHRWGISLPIGVAMMMLGGALTMLAAWRYHVVNRDIERGKVSADRGLVVLVTVMVTLLSVAMIVFALLTAKQP
jgi:putative membrane protein